MEPQLRRLIIRLRSRKALLLYSLILFTMYILDKPYPSNFTQPVTTTTAATPEEKAVNISAVKPIVNPYPFNFTISSSSCLEEELLFVVHSAVSYHRRRMLMRDTWLNRRVLEHNLDRRVKIIFVIGATNDTMVQTYLNYEHELYGDIVQSDFVDNYQNNTYKAISYMRWVSHNCANASLVVKVDDDALIHPKRMSRLKQTIEKLLDYNATDLYSGRLLSRVVNRDEKSKWFTSRDVWKEDLYPVWFQGLVYFLTPDLATKLIPIALTTHYMFTDDVYVGVLVSQVPNATVVTINNLGAHTQGKIEKDLKKQFLHSKILFYHIPDTRIFYQWFHRDDLTNSPIKEKTSPSKSKQKESSWVVVVVLLPFMFFSCWYV